MSRILALAVLCAFPPATYALCAAPRSSRAVLDALLSWCGKNGVGGLENVHIDEFEAGLGIFAARAILPGEELLRIPLRLALADRLIPGVDGKPPPPSPWRDAPWQAALAARLSTEELDGSEWQPWLRTLPRGVQGLPLSMQPVLQYQSAAAELAALHADRAALAARTASALSEAAAAEEAAPSAARVEQALTLASTRAFLLELEPGDPWACCHAFVPLLDLFNHSPLDDSHVEWSLQPGASLSLGCLSLTARAPAKAGEQLTLTYDPTAANDVRPQPGADCH